MADPISLTLAIVGTVLATTGTAIGTVSAVQQSRAQANLAEHNAALAERDKKFRQEQARFNEERARERHKEILARQRVSGAASGAGLAGSLLDAIGETVVQSELEALTIRRTGQFEADSLQARADASRARAAGFNSQASTTLTAGLFQTAGTAVSGAAGIYGQFGPSPTATTPQTSGLTQRYISSQGAQGSNFSLGVF